MSIFINHIPKDDQFVDKLRDKLHTYGFRRTWVDHIDTPSDAEKVKTIQQILEESSVMLMVASDAKTVSDQITAEWDTFHNEWKRPVFLLMTENFPIPDKLRSIQRFDFTDQAQFGHRFRELLSVLWTVVWIAETRLVADIIQNRSALSVQADELKLVVPIDQDEIICKLDHPLRVGRWHKREKPDIDLSGYDRQYGLSRSHAEFTYEYGKLYITDLGSKNGTFLNGKRLESGKPYLLDDRDIVHFGGLGTQVYFGEHEAKGDVKPKKKTGKKHFGVTDDLVDPTTSEAAISSAAAISKIDITSDIGTTGDIAATAKDELADIIDDLAEGMDSE